MRSANIYYQNQKAGMLTETDDGEYVFQYETAYIENHPDQFVSFTMPVRQEKYVDNRLFPFLKVLFPKAGYWTLPLKVGR